MRHLTRLWLTSTIVFAACGEAGEPSGPVTVTFRDSSTAPVPNIPIVFNHADGTVAEVVTTDADGRATAVLEAGGSVTAIEQRLMYNIQTVLDVQPGDELTLGRAAAPADHWAGTVTINATPVEGATWYKAVSACGELQSTTLPIKLDLGTVCAGTRGSVIVWASDGTYTVATDVEFAVGGKITMPPTWKSPHDFVASFTHVDPAVIYGLEVDRQTPFGTTPKVGAKPTEPSLSLTLPAVEEAPSATLGVRAYHVTPTGAWSGQIQGTNLPIAGDATAHEYDLSTELRPWLGARISYIRGLIRVDAPDDTTADLVSVYLVINHPQHLCYRTIIGPAVREVTVPTLPAEFALCNTAYGDALDNDAVTYVWWSELHDYDLVRADIVARIERFATERPATASFSQTPILGQAQ